jgi:ceramide glucosyltransferase
LDQWDREVRWIRCARVSRPHEYPALIFSFSTPLAVAYAILSGFSFQGLWVLAASFALRWLVAWRVTVYTGDREVRRWLAWLPVRDVLSFLVWCAGSVGRRTIWRGEEYLLQPDGKMHPIQPATDQSTARRVVWGFSNRIGGAVHKSVDYVGQTISAALARIR